MASVDDFKYVLTLWKELELPEIIDRDIELDLDADKVIVIAGVRRAGKTSIMFHYIKSLIKRGIGRDNIIYVNFENERLIATKATDLDNMLVAHSQLFSPNDRIIYLFLDEIQNVENWDKWVRKIYDTKRYRVIITGSSSKLLSSEIATALAGRNLSYIVYPFSLTEMLKAKGIEARTLKYSPGKGAVLKTVDELLEYGAFPEVVLARDITRKMELLSSYFDAIFFRDIVKRYNLRETGALSIFLKILAGNYASYFSSTKVHNYFRSMGFGISRVTILNFLDYSKAVFFAEILEQYAKSPRKRFARQAKSYVIDMGLAKLFADIDKGRALENAVLIELLRRKKAMDRICYVKLDSGMEIDFLVERRGKELIQVCYDISAEGTKKRETTALIEAARRFNLKRGTVITYDYSGSDNISGIKIEYIPFWIWAQSHTER